MISETTTIDEIRNMLGVSRNQVKTIMKKYGVHHDGTSEMRYSTIETKNAIEKHLNKVEQVKKHRQKISSKRRGIIKETMRATTDNSGLTRKELAKSWEVDPYYIKDAIRHGIIPVQDNGRVPEDFVLKNDSEDVLDKLFSKKEYDSRSAARILGVKEQEFNDFMSTEGLYSEDGFYNGSLVFELAGGRIINEPPIEIYSANATEEKEFTPHPTINIPSSNRNLEYVGFHLGPTNSGKTYNALESLCKEFEEAPDGKYVYACPLRMLAYEIYVKMVERYGEESVGFITGEESINPDAPIIAATTEMTPLRGDTLIVDEAHWILDEERGHYWTRLLLSGNYTKMHIIAAQEAAGGLSALVSDARVTESQIFKRRTGISFDGGTLIRNIKPRTVVVCFSRKDVYKIYEELLVHNIRACVLYGALPVEVRKKQIQDYENGVYDVVVTTNVIGHGINLPIDHVVFAGTERFDGQVRIQLPLWEAGQISGRAGRYGISEKGCVTVLEGIQSATPEKTIVRGGVNVAAGRVSSGLEFTSPYVFPKFEDLGIGDENPQHIIEAVEHWAKRISNETNYTPAPMRIMRSNAKAVSSFLGSAMVGLYSPKNPQNWKISAKDLWTLLSGPFDSKSGVILSAAEWLGNRDNDNTLCTDFLRFVKYEEKADLESLEFAYSALSEFKMLAVVFGDEHKNLGRLKYENILSIEEHLVNRIQKKIEEYPASFAHKKNSNRKY